MTRGTAKRPLPRTGEAEIIPNHIRTTASLITVPYHMSYSNALIGERDVLLSRNQQHNDKPRKISIDMTQFVNNLQNTVKYKIAHQ